VSARLCAAWALEVKCGLLSLTRLRSIVPIEIRDELTCEDTPLPVRTWMQHLPRWLEVLATPIVTSEDSSLEGLDTGERAAIVLAESMCADLLLIDDRAGAILAQRRGLAVTGTIGVLDLASRGGMLDLRDAFVRLQEPRPPAELVAIRAVSHGRDRKGLVSRMPEPSTIV
jgi:predicted nucleic acid-binding protein